MTPGEVIAEDMRKLPTELRKALRPRLRMAGQVIANAARANASWSSRIPGTIKVGTKFSPNREGVYIRAGGASAPHARLYELGSRSPSSFRHPVFGHRDRWVEQTTRPFLFRAAEQHVSQTTVAIENALSDAAHGIGF